MLRQPGGSGLSFDRFRKAGAALLLAVATLLPSISAAQTPEFRAFWADAWSDDLWTVAGISRLVADTRAGNMNAVIPQVRRRGDALYNSAFEPKCYSISPQFDPLAELLARAHDTNAGPRIEVHAWLVTYHVWKASGSYPKPPSAAHVVNAHPDWLLVDNKGQSIINSEYTLDPGHPAVQEHTFNVAMDLVRNYDIDGLNFDYIRYSSADEGYNPVTLERFKRLCKRVINPTPQDPVWKQFRRDQVTALLRKIYLCAIELKPGIKISCDTITWSPAPTNTSSWYATSSAWNSVLQDWRGWMQEGILDLNIPMNYFRQAGPSHAMAYINWSNFAKNNRYNRHTAIGPGIYLNSISGSIQQMRQAREPASSGNAADGIACYSFRATNTNGLPRSAFLSALVSPGAHDPIPVPIFAQPVPVPDMPWKTQPSRGHLKGFVREGTGPLDGAVVALSGPARRAQTNDATGFYGFVDLEPGVYTVSASWPGLEPAAHSIEVTAGRVSTVDLQLHPLPPVLDGIARINSSLVEVRGSGATGAMVMEWTPDLSNWQPLTNFTTLSNSFKVMDPSATNRERYYRARRAL